MGTLLRFKATTHHKPDRPASAGPGRDCEIVIFPGVRIERHDLDLGHRVRDTIGQSGIGDGTDGRRPRKTS